jgi:hypothetical protein
MEVATGWCATARKILAAVSHTAAAAAAAPVAPEAMLQDGCQWWKDKRACTPLDGEVLLKEECWHTQQCLCQSISLVAVAWACEYA